MEVTERKGLRATAGDAVEWDGVAEEEEEEEEEAAEKEADLGLGDGLNVTEAYAGTEAAAAVGVRGAAGLIGDRPDAGTAGVVLLADAAGFNCTEAYAGG